MARGRYERLASRLRPTEALRTIEDSVVIARALTLTLWLSALQVLVSAVIWAVLGEEVLAWVAVILAGTFMMTWVLLEVTGSVYAAVVFAFLTGTASLVAFHVLLGGFAYSGAILLFGTAYVAIVALLLGKRMTIAAGILYALIAVTLGFLEASLRESRLPPHPTTSTVFFVVVLLGSIDVVTPMIVYFMGRLSYERERAERLLLNVLPRQVAAELKEHGRTQARRLDEVSVLFADIVGFTPYSADLDPEDIVARLNEAFTHLDTLCDRYGVEKIRTMGDAYMAVSGAPIPRPDHAESLARMALEMRAYAGETPFQFRIGINSGPVVAGVIGTRKFQYDIWGDTVNTASRMESHGEPGRIQITEATRALLGDRFTTTARGTIEVKGKGQMTTWWLEGAQDET